MQKHLFATIYIRCHPPCRNGRSALGLRLTFHLESLDAPTFA